MTTRYQTKGPRKVTVFDFCERHASLNALPKYRRAEFVAEGGPAHAPCDPNRPCAIYPGTDFFIADVCHGRYPTDTEWRVNRP